jgi:hypothetical protein
MLGIIGEWLSVGIGIVGGECWIPLGETPGAGLTTGNIERGIGLAFFSGELFPETVTRLGVARPVA